MSPHCGETTRRWFSVPWEKTSPLRYISYKFLIMKMTVYQSPLSLPPVIVLDHYSVFTKTIYWDVQFLQTRLDYWIVSISLCISLSVGICVCIHFRRSGIFCHCTAFSVSSKCFQTGVILFHMLQLEPAALIMCTSKAFKC